MAIRVSKPKHDIWSSFLIAAYSTLGVAITIALLVAVAAWWTILPSIGFLWLIGAL